MPNVSLDFYSIKFKISRQRGAYLSLDNVLNGAKFDDFFVSFASTFSATAYVDQNAKKTFRSIPDHLQYASDKRMIRGIIRAGEYGQRNEVEDAFTGESKQPISLSDSVISPMYFLLCFPPGYKFGFLAVQRIGQKGIFSVFNNNFKKFIQNEHENITVECSQLASRELVEMLVQNGEIEEVKIKAYSVPHDKADRYMHGGLIGDDVLSATLSLVPRKNFWGMAMNNKILKYLRSPNTRFFEIPELENIGFSGPVETSVKVFNGVKSRTVSLDKPEKFKVSFDITNEVAIDPENGFPVFSSIDRIAQELLFENFLQP